MDTWYFVCILEQNQLSLHGNGEYIIFWYRFEMCTNGDVTSALD
jgi:hypothetical protein